MPLGKSEIDITAENVHHSVDNVASKHCSNVVPLKHCITSTNM